MNQENSNFNLKSITDQVSSTPLRFIKILLGILLTYFTLRAYYYDVIIYSYVIQTFRYPVWPQLNWIINTVTIPYFFLGSLICSIAIIFEKKFPWPFIGYLICFIPIVVFDQTYYQDYQLAIIITCVLLSLTNPSHNNRTSFKWELLSIKCLFSIILMWRGVAYLYTDWLNGDVWHHAVSTQLYYSPFLIKALQHPALTALIIALLPLLEITSAILPWKHPRYLIITWIYFIAYSIFYSYGNSIFGFNPIMSILGILSIAFIPTSLFEQLKIRLTKKYPQQSQSPTLSKPSRSRFLKPCLIIYVIIQLLLPFNIYVVKDQPWYNTIPSFAWTMKQESREYSGNFIIVDPVTNKVLDEVFAKDQIRYSSTILTMAKKINQEYQEAYHISPRVYGNISIKINNRPRVPYINPEIDLSKVDYKLERKPSWILPPPKGYFK